jgi:hypothetical protein
VAGLGGSEDPESYAGCKIATGRLSHKFTCYSWDGQLKSIIDYVIITKEVRNKLTNGECSLA